VHSARAARRSARLTVREAAARLRITEGYLRHIERGGALTHRLAQRMARLYAVPMATFSRRRARTAETEEQEGTAAGATRGRLDDQAQRHRAVDRRPSGDGDREGRG
jgi:transcriptional regulator with XRE-family HTH domain